MMNKMRSVIMLSIFFLLITFVTTAETNGFVFKAATVSQPISNNEDLQKANLTILVGTGGGQTLYGKFGNEELTQWIPNLLFKYPLIFEMSPIIETADYQIITKDRLYRYDTTIKEGSGWWPFSEDAKCDTSALYCFDMINESVLEVNKVYVGSYGSLENPNLKWKGDAKVIINGIPYTKEISSEVGSVQFNSITGEFVALMSWDGSTITGQSLPDQHNNVPIYTLKNNEWTISTSTLYDDYSNSIVSTDTKLSLKNDQRKIYEATSYNSDTRHSICGDDECSSIMTLINTHNAKLTLLLNSREKISYESSISSKSEQYINTKDGNVLLVLNRRITIPEFTIKTIAKNIGAYIPTGEFQILDITSPTFSSGDNNGKVDIKIRNTGNYKGTAVATLIDESNTFTQVSNSKSLETTLEPGKESTVTMYISTSETDLSKTAKIEVYDINNPTNKSSKDFTASVTKPKLCQPNSQRLDNKIVYTCNSDGSAEYLTLDCTNGIPNYDNNTYVCTQIEYNKDLTITTPAQIIEVQNKTPPKEPEKESNFMDLTYWIIAFLILYYLSSMIRKYRNKENTTTDENIKKSLTSTLFILGIVYVYIEFKYMTETLGDTFWFIVIGSGILAGLFDVYQKQFKHLMNIPRIYIFTLGLILIIVLSNIAIGIKEITCDNIMTSWLASKIFDTCNEWSLSKYISEWF